MKKIRAITISSGNFSMEVLKKVKLQDDLIICADGGARHLYKADLVPDMIVGDLDSLDITLVNHYQELGVEFFKYSSEKDYTDTELSIEYAIEKGARDIIMLGATGTRLDHTLANILLLYKLVNRGIDARIIDEHNEIYIVDKAIEIAKEDYSYVSLLPILGDVLGVTMSGFKYPTDNMDFELGSTMGISNEIKNEYGEIYIKNGVSLIIKSRD